MAKRIVIISPTYNEKDNISKLTKKIDKVVSNIKSYSFTILFVDDSSPDGTLNEIIKIKNSGLKGLKIEYISRKDKNGLGKAYLTGMDYALESLGADFIIQMDADLSHQPKYLLHFTNSFSRGAELVVASRYIPGGDTPGWPWYRKLISSLGNHYNRLFLGDKITDYTGGFNGYEANLLKKLLKLGIKSSGYGFMTEIKFRAMKSTDNIKQIPIKFIDREHGKSKIPKSTIFKSLLLAPKLRFNIDENE